jgi:hypothetical protein
MAWRGKPKWNGKEVTIELEGCVLPFAFGIVPFMISIENCEDMFLPIFSEKDDLDKFMNDVGKKAGVTHWTVKQVDVGGKQEFMDSILSQGVRIMLNPNIINEHHTKWLEVIKQGDQWRYVDVEKN